MDPLDKKIKDFLARERRMSAANGGGDCPTTEDYYKFAAGELEGEALHRMLSHLKAHPDDADVVKEARELLRLESESDHEAVPFKLVERASELGRSRPEIQARRQLPSLSCPHCEKPITPFKRSLGSQRLRNAVWLGLAAFAFGLSFLVSRYFLQFLGLGLLFGVKWALDAKATRTQILIYKALREKEADVSIRSRDVQNIQLDE